MTISPEITSGYIDHTIRGVVYILECIYCGQKIYNHNFLNDDLCHLELSAHNKVCPIRNIL